ncbi:MAG: hypothetical protein FJY82_08990 [Candidatus Aminicenantes bacterium]|nr:hypothetical protein [Candidatus Aminicenantes bacterium]
MTRRKAVALLVAPALALAVAASWSARQPPRQLKSFSQLLAALQSGAPVRAVFHYKDMTLFIKGKEEASIPEAVGGMDVGAFEYFAPGSIGNPEGFLSFSHLQLITHARHGTVYNYVKVSVFETNKVRILARYLAPGTYAVKMDETFETEVNDGANRAGAYFYLVGSGGEGRPST